MPVKQGNRDVLYHGPIRQRTDFLGWDGSQFVPLLSRYAPPTYRFEAVEDGDRAFRGGDYNLALKFYRQAIEDPKLEWWSEQRYLHMQAGLDAGWQQQPSPTPLPPVSSEYPRLAAYANYRIILAYLAQGQVSYAEEAYKNFLAGFPPGKPGRVYAEMAQTFWQAYQSAASLDQGCRQANAYLEQHQDEILGVLDYSWHGWQSLEYEPEMVCPFE